MRLNWNLLLLALALAAALMGAACSGINASGSVSPATFLLPGLMQNESPQAPPADPFPGSEPAPTLAQAR